MVALVKYTQLAGGGMLKIVNGSVSLGLENLGYSATEVTDIANDGMDYRRGSEKHCSRNSLSRSIPAHATYG